MFNPSTDNFKHSITSLLAGNPPNGIAPTDCGEWGALLDQGNTAHASGGTAAVVRWWNVQTAADTRLLKLLASDAPKSASGESWAKPLPFVQHDLPAFPVGVFPDWLRSYVEAETEAKQVPVDLVAMLALAVLSTACARRVVVIPKAGRFEPVNLFVVTALPPGSRKSATFGAMVAPIVAYEHEVMAAGDAARDRAALEHEILEGRLQDAKRDASKAKGTTERENAIERADNLASELREHTIPPVPRLIFDNISTEMLASMLVEHDGRAAILSPEGDVFGMMAGRYSGDSAPNFDVYLKAHAGDDLRVDRRSRKSEMVRLPALTMGLAVQPEVIRNFGDKRSMRGLGLLGRFLYSLPVSTVGYRKIDADPVPPETSATYQRNVTRLLRNARDLVDCGNCGNCGNAKEDCGNNVQLGNNSHLDTLSLSLLILTTDAKALLYAWDSWLEPQLAEDAAFGWFADWAGKLTGAILRIAALLHMAEIASHNSHNSHNCKRAITEQTLGRAIAIGQYLIPHAIAAFGEMNANPSTHAAGRVLAWIETHELREFTKRDAWQGVRGSFRQAADLDPVLELLAYQGYIRPIEADERPGAGRKPSQRYEVNPLALHAASRSTSAPLPTFAASYIPPPAESGDGYRAIGGY